MGISSINSRSAAYLLENIPIPHPPPPGWKRWHEPFSGSGIITTETFNHDCILTAGGLDSIQSHNLGPSPAIPSVPWFVARISEASTVSRKSGLPGWVRKWMGRRPVAVFSWEIRWSGRFLWCGGIGGCETFWRLNLAQRDQESVVCLVLLTRWMMDECEVPSSFQRLVQSTGAFKQQQSWPWWHPCVLSCVGAFHSELHGFYLDSSVMCVWLCSKKKRREFRHSHSGRGDLWNPTVFSLRLHHCRRPGLTKSWVKWLGSYPPGCAKNHQDDMKPIFFFDQRESQPQALYWICLHLHPGGSDIEG